MHSLRDNTTLLSLNLAGNNISEVGGRYIADAFHTMNQHLTSLCLDNNALGPYGCQFIAEVIKVNSAITELYLTNNNILDEGVDYLSDGLKVNTVLNKISLDKNQITEMGKQELAHALSINPNLKILMKL